MTNMANIRPIQITVTKTNWTAHALSSISTPRDLELIKLLDSMGGINESVEPGIYHFNVMMVEGLGQHVASLQPAK